MPNITLTSGATTLILDQLDPKSVVPMLDKNFTQNTLGDNSKVYDVIGSPKKRWELKQEVPLSTQQTTDLDAIFLIKTSITLTENWLESGTVYNVFFERIMPRIDTFSGDIKRVLILQEV